MNKKALQSILRQARESGIIQPANKKGADRFSDVWEIKTNNDTYKNLIELLRKSKDLDYFNMKLFRCGYMDIIVMHKTLAKYLLYRTSEVGEVQTVNELAKYNRSIFTPAIKTLVILGTEIDKEVHITENISLVPFKDIPECWQKHNTPTYLKEITRTTSPFRKPLFNDNCTSLIEKDKIKPKCYDQGDKSKRSQFSPNMSHRICDCLTLVGKSIPTPSIFWCAVEDWVPCSLLLNSGWAGGACGDISNIHSYKLTSKDCSLVSKYIRQYLDLPEKIQQILNISLQRLNLSRKRNTLTDKAIDLGIALESILLHDGGPEQPISLPFRLRGAWLLGRNPKERLDYKSLFQDIYSCRCHAVHSGTLKDGRKLSKNGRKLCLTVRELLQEGDGLCVSIIKQILQKKMLPVFDKMILGGGWQ